ncbi:hypothetical protein AWENTII_006865 [Aspergillus wentii]
MKRVNGKAWSNDMVTQLWRTRRGISGATREGWNVLSLSTQPEIHSIFLNSGNVLQGRKSIKPKEKVKEPVKEKKTPDKRTPRSHRMSLRASSTSNVRSIVVPTEIILTIMDRLPDIDDILSLLWVFPHWKGLIPQGYWRIRCINELVLDEDQVPDRDSLNWGYLYFNIDDILARSHGWRNRRRIMTILEGTKEMFLKELAKHRMGKNGHTRC